MPSVALERPSRFDKSPYILIMLKGIFGNYEAQFEIGHRYYENRNYKKAEKWLKKAVDREQEPIYGQKRLYAQIYSMLIYAEQEKYEQLFDLSKKLAHKGNPYAQFFIGNIYAQGIGDVPINPEEAIKWWKKAAEQGNEEAQHNLGVLYEKGWVMYKRGWKVVPDKDYTKSVQWYTKAAEQGNMYSQYNLGLMLMHEKGKGIHININEIIKWWKEAAKQGSKRAQFALGLIHYVYLEEYEEGLDFWKKLVQQGHFAAEFTLRIIHEEDTIKGFNKIEEKMKYTKGYTEVYMF